MRRIKGILIALVAGISLILGTGVNPAAASGSAPTEQLVTAGPSCQEWFDAFTYGGSCTFSNLDYRARASCANGSIARGQWKTGGAWSYAYCSTYGSYLTGNWALETRDSFARTSAEKNSAEVTASPQAKTSARAIPCQGWWDGNTTGVACSGSAQYRAAAECQNDQNVYGNWASNWAWSYAYCTSVGSSIRYRWIDWR